VQFTKNNDSVTDSILGDFVFLEKKMDFKNSLKIHYRYTSTNSLHHSKRPFRMVAVREEYDPYFCDNGGM